MEHLQSTHITDDQGTSTGDGDITMEDEHLLDEADEESLNNHADNDLPSDDILHNEEDSNSSSVQNHTNVNRHQHEQNQTEVLSTPAIITNLHHRIQDVRNQTEVPPPSVNTNEHQPVQDAQNQPELPITPSSTEQQSTHNLPVPPPLAFNLPSVNTSPYRLPLLPTPQHLLNPNSYLQFPIFPQPAPHHLFEATTATVASRPTTTLHHVSNSSRILHVKTTAEATPVVQISTVQQSSWFVLYCRIQCLQSTVLLSIIARVYA